VVARTVAALAARGDLVDAEYREAVSQVGTAGVFELLTLVGYYATLALQLRVFRVPAPDDAARPAWERPLDTAPGRPQ
jgi:4-carboxymuconolactone decarboxylase